MTIDARIAHVEEVVGKPLIVRAVVTPEPQFRGYVEVRADSIVIEYAEETPGYFWGYELLEELLDWVESGGDSAWFHLHDRRLIRIPVYRETCEDKEGGTHCS